MATDRPPRTGPDSSSTTAQPSDTTIAASEFVAALERGWAAIQEHHPELPDTVIVLGTGVERGRLVKLGHWWGGQWQVGSEPRGEVLLAGEALNLPADDVFAVLLHEAAHSLNAARGIRDASRGGRYHNGNFRTTAAAMGLRVDRADPYGWARTSLGELARERYAGEITRIAEQMRLARHMPARGAEGVGKPGTEGAQSERGGERNRSKRPAAECGCGRKMRMAPSVLVRGPVVCGLCSTEFETPRQASADPARGELRSAKPAQFPEPDGRSFLDRRRERLEAEPARPDHEADALAHLDRFERAVDALAATGDAEDERMAEVFARLKPDLVRWVESLFEAEVIPFPEERPTSRDSSEERDPTVGERLDLRTVDLRPTRDQPRETGPEPPGPELPGSSP